MARGRKLLRAVQARSSHIDGARILVVSVGERGATTLAERPAHLVGRTVVGRLTMDEGELFERERKPCYRLRARCPAARDAVANYRFQRLSGHPVSHTSAETPTLAHITVHPFFPSSTRDHSSSPPRSIGESR